MHRYGWIFLIGFFLFSSPLYACKMTPFGASRAALAAVVEHVSSTDNLREIKLIRRVESKDSNWVYVVETQDQGKHCKAVAYAVSFEPSCKPMVKLLGTRFNCLR